MKKIIIFSFLALFLLNGYSQEKKLEFTKKISYKITQNVPFSKEKQIVNIYYSPKNEFVLIEGITQQFLMILRDSEEYNLSISLDRKAQLLESFFPLSSITTFFDFQKSTEQKLGNQVIDGFKTTGYSYKTIKKQQETRLNYTQYSEDVKGDFFIDENNNIDIVKIIAPNSGLEGLPISFKIFNFESTGDKTDFISLELVDIKDINEFIVIDLEAEIKRINDLKIEREDQIQKQLEYLQESELDYSELDYIEDLPIGEDFYFTEYVSTYTESDDAYTNLVIDDKYMFSDNSGNWNVIPKYCKEIDTIIPKFKNTNLSKHLRNYIGQICDMYYGEYNSNVAHKGTLDEIRKETQYFMNIMESLGKEDKKLLLDFLDGLD